MGRSHIRCALLRCRTRDSNSVCFNGGIHTRCTTARSTACEHHHAHWVATHRAAQQRVAYVWTVLYCANALHWLNSKQHRRCFVPAYDLNRLAIWNSLTFYHQMRQSLAWPMQEIMIHTANVILFSWFCAPYKDHYSNLSFRTFCLIYILTGILFEHAVMANS